MIKAKFGTERIDTGRWQVANAWWRKVARIASEPLIEVELQLNDGDYSLAIELWPRDYSSPLSMVIVNHAVITGDDKLNDALFRSFKA